jgi:hypothetical protein
MAGLVPAIRVFVIAPSKDVADQRDKPCADDSLQLTTL